MSAKQAGLGTARLVSLNGEPAVRFSIGGELDTVGMLRIERGHVAEVYLIRHPDKLAALTSGAQPH